MRFFLSIFLLLGSVSISYSQDLEGEKREEFVKEQEAYLEKLSLSENQKRKYFARVRNFQKNQQNILNSRLSKTEKQKKLKLAEKMRDEEMKEILSDAQFKKFLQRQKEIKKKYGDF